MGKYKLVAPHDILDEWKAIEILIKQGIIEEVEEKKYKLLKPHNLLEAYDVREFICARTACYECPFNKSSCKPTEAIMSELIAKGIIREVKENAESL